MLQMIITFLILAIVAGALGFTGVEGAALDISRVLFFIFIILFILSFVANIFRGQRPPMN